MKPVAVLLLATLTLLGACRNDGPEPDATTTSTTAVVTTTASTTTAPTTATSSPPQPTPRGCTAVTGGGQTFLQLTDVRVGTHPGYDRVTFEFAPPSSGTPPAPPGLLPRYELNRVREITEDGSGNPVRISGRDLFLIVFHGASGVELAGEQPVLTYKGPKELKPNFKVLSEVERSGDFEATLSWGFGLSEPRCPKVTEFQNPLRVAVDFPH
jgi:hypothetical protein